MPVSTAANRHHRAKADVAPLPSTRPVTVRTRAPVNIHVPKMKNSAALQIPISAAALDRRYRSAAMRVRTVAEGVRLM